MSRFLTSARRLYLRQQATTPPGGLNYARRPVNTIPSAGSNLGQVVGSTLYSPNARLYSQTTSLNRRPGISLLLAGRNLLYTGVLQRFSVAPPGKVVEGGSQAAWKRFYKRPSSSRQKSVVIKRIAQAVGLGFRRSYGTTPAPFTSFGARAQMLSGGLNKFAAVQPGKALVKQTQVALKNFYRRHSSNLRTSLPIRRIAQAVSISVNRSYVVIPGIYAIVRGRSVTYAQAQAQGQLNVGFTAPRKSLFMRAQDGYALSVNLATSFFQGIILLFRALHLAFLFSPCIAMIPFASSFGHKYRKFWLQLVHRTLERAGPAFIKWGQWAASRPDLFPQDLCTELSKLHTKAPEHSFAYTKKTIEKAFGCKLSDIFDDFGEQPVASGSIAQVHRATLKPEFRGHEMKTREVAVKVRHPGVGDKIKRDFEIMNVAARLSKAIPALEWLRLDESVQQFAVFMMSQVDLAREAANLSRFEYNFRRWKNVSFPKPVLPLVNPSVLVESFEHGECVSHYVDELQGHERLKSSLAHIGTHALLKMLLVDNFIHADMHPGNILVREGQSKRPRRRLFKSKPHVIFLDVGMTAELSGNDRTNLVEFFKSVARRDGQTAAECALRLSKKQNCPNPQAFIKEVRESFDFWGTPEGDLVHPADCMHQLLEKVRRHRVNIDGNVCTVMVTTLVLEGWQRKLDPDYDVMHTLQTILLKADWAKSLSYTIEGLMAP